MVWSSKTFHRYLPPLVLVISLFALYLGTMAPGLTWAHAGSDGGDLITAAARGGIAHPTGYPLYLLLARLFQFLPLGSLAYRTNLLSAVAMTLASGLIFLVVRDSFPDQKETNWLAALTAGFAFGSASLVWSQAVITEVYGLQAFLLALILYLYLRPPQKHLDLWRGLALGLGMSNHVTTLMLVPAMLAAGSLRSEVPTEGDTDSTPRPFRHVKFDGGALLRQLGTFVAGSSLYLILPLRALSHPPVSWGDPVTLGRFWWLVSGQLYQSYYLQFDPSEWWGRVQAWAALLLGQWGLIGLALSLLGLIYFFSPSRLFLLTLWQALVYSGFAMLYGSADSYVYLLPVCISLSVWIGVGLAGILNREIRHSRKIGLVVGALFLLYLVGSAAYHWRQVDVSKDLEAEAFGHQVFASAPANALLFAKGDEAVFASWYFHFALRERPDLSVIATDLLHFDWYQENLRSAYPALIVPGPFPFPETVAQANPARPVCYVQNSDPGFLDCSQSVNAGTQ